MSKHEESPSNLDGGSDEYIPEGLDFLELVSSLEHKCRETTASQYGNLGRKAPECLSSMGTILSLLDRVASCWWGCNGGSHQLEYLVGRSASSAMAVLQVAQAGYYDEALNQVRSLGEIANLFALFAADPTSLRAWAASSKKERLSQFGPAAVRKSLERLQAPMPISAERYSVLCELVTHPTPSTKPQSYNPLHMPSVGHNFQPAGYLVVLNELALPLSFIAVFILSLVTLPSDVRFRIRTASRALAESIGGANLVNGVPTLTDDARQDLASLIRNAPLEQQRGLKMAILEAAQQISTRGSVKTSVEDDSDDAI
ncbi:hypothetical protein [Bordetella bronchiseptica]